MTGSLGRLDPPEVQGLRVRLCPTSAPTSLTELFLGLPCSDVDAVLSRANATEFGLASGVFTRDINKALYVSDKLQAGTVFVNTYNKTDVAAPFGGFKQSGFGKDLGNLALKTCLGHSVPVVVPEPGVEGLTSYREGQATTKAASK